MEFGGGCFLKARAGFAILRTKPIRGLQIPFEHLAYDHSDQYGYVIHPSFLKARAGFAILRTKLIRYCKSPLSIWRMTTAINMGM